ncbi:MAG TPA: hypothetical protein VK927_07060 [Adhaeribacter sp.]|nr:hypothetical protein [Adhaeribacter sp.]
MKRLIYLTYLGLLLFILIANQKENLAPAESNSQKSISSYNNKTGVVQLAIFSNPAPAVRLIQEQSLITDGLPDDTQKEEIFITVSELKQDISISLPAETDPLLAKNQTKR